MAYDTLHLDLYWSFDNTINVIISLSALQYVKLIFVYFYYFKKNNIV